MNPHSSHQNRRRFLRSLGGGFGMTALGALASGNSPAAAKAPHFPAKVKRVIFIFVPGGPSQMDLFDPKPILSEKAGQVLPFDVGNDGRPVTGNFTEFAQHGESGAWVSNLMPELTRHVDDICFLKGMHTDTPAHVQGSIFYHTGQQNLPRPSIGSWILYGLGAESENVPGFITLRPPDFSGGARLYSSAFLPATFQGTPIGGELEPFAGATIPNISNEALTPRLQRQQLAYARQLNEQSMVASGASDPRIQGLVESYELAFRMQSAVPDLLDLSREPATTHELYGIGEGKPTDSFGRQCLLARRFAEAGVRFIQLNSTSGRQNNWDHHNVIPENLPLCCRETDKPVAALLDDLKRTGLWDDTLVVWGGEFGRTPHGIDGKGRDHNNLGFTTWLAGGGVKPGISHGETDEFGARAINGRVHVHDLHATILHLLGLDHEQLTYPWGGRDFRLTDVHGRVVREILT